MSKSICQLSLIAVLVCLIINTSESYAGEPPRSATITVYTSDEIAKAPTSVMKTFRPLIQAHRVLIRIPFRITDPLGPPEPVEISTPYRTHGGVI